MTSTKHPDGESLRVLVACEYSGTVRDAFLRRGCDAMSCYLLPSESSGKHYLGDVRNVPDDGWYLMICGLDGAHPKCMMRGMKTALIDDFPAYRVTDLGNIETRWRTGNFYNGFTLPDMWKTMRTNQRPDGYLGVELRDGRGKSRKTYVHILVAEAFHGKRPFPKACVRHLDGDPANNRSANLAWGTFLENEEDKRRHGTWESRFGGKLTREQRDRIRIRHAKGESQRALAEEYSVSRPSITRLVNGTTWRDSK